MDDWRPYRVYRKQRLDELLKEAGGPKGLMDLSGVTDTHLTACQKGRRPIGDEMAEKLEHAMSRPTGWMDTPPDGKAVPLAAASVSLDRALARVAQAVADAPPDRIAALAENMAGWVRNGAQEPWTGIVKQLLTPPTGTLADHGADLGHAAAAADALNSRRSASSAAPALGQQSDQSSQAEGSRKPRGAGHEA